MMISQTTFSIIIMLALGLTLLSPIVLLWLWIRDWKRGSLW